MLKYIPNSKAIDSEPKVSKTTWKSLKPREVSATGQIQHFSSIKSNCSDSTFQFNQEQQNIQEQKDQKFTGPPQTCQTCVLGWLWACLMTGSLSLSK